MTAPFTIDLHTHILPPELPDLRARYGYGGFVALERAAPAGSGAAPRGRMTIDGAMFREIPDTTWDLDRRIEDCDRHGISVQVLSTVPVMFCYWAEGEHAHDLARLLNDHVAQAVAARPGRFAGLATLPMQAPDLAVRELERCVRTLGLAGAQIGTHVNAWNLDAPELFPIFAAARDLGAALFIHPWDMMGAERMRKYWLPRQALEHGGGAFPGTLGRIQQDRKSVV